MSGIAEENGMDFPECFLSVQLLALLGKGGRYMWVSKTQWWCITDVDDTDDVDDDANYDDDDDDDDSLLTFKWEGGVDLLAGRQA